MAMKIKMPEDISDIQGTTSASAAASSEAKPRRSRRVARDAAATERVDASTDAGGAAQAPVASVAPRSVNKITQVITLLERGEGTTLAELVAATGWLSHTTRAALTGLRKKGHAIARDKRGEVTCYRIASAA